MDAGSCCPHRRWPNGFRNLFTMEPSIQTEPRRGERIQWPTPKCSCNPQWGRCAVAIGLIGQERLEQPIVSQFGAATDPTKPTKLAFLQVGADIGLAKVQRIRLICGDEISSSRFADSFWPQYCFRTYMS